MAWLKKKKDDIEIPDLPDLPDSGEYPEDINEDEQLNDAPLEGYNPEEPIPEIPELEGDAEEDTEKPKEEPKVKKYEPLKEFSTGQPTSYRKLPETKFIRIDKFETSYEAILSIKQKIDEMNALLKSLKQINSKEDYELSNWEKEISEIRAKIESIDKALFEEL